MTEIKNQAINSKVLVLITAQKGTEWGNGYQMSDKARY